MIPSNDYYIDIDGIFSVEDTLRDNPEIEFVKYNISTDIPIDIWSEVRIAALILHKLNLPWYFKMRDVTLMRKEPMEEMSFNFDEDTQIRFTYGDCGFLALDLYYKLRWDIYGLYFLPNHLKIPNVDSEDSEEFINNIKQKYEASHYINLVPTTIPQLLMLADNIDNQSLFVDITGIKSFTNLIKYWKELNSEDITHQRFLLVKVNDDYVKEHNCIFNLISKQIESSSYQKIELQRDLETELTKINDISISLIQKMELSKHYSVKKVIEVKNSPLYQQFSLLLRDERKSEVKRQLAKSQMNSDFFKEENYYKRLINNYKKAYELGVGPKVEFEICDNFSDDSSSKNFSLNSGKKLIINMEYIPIQNNKITYKKKVNHVKELTERLHQNNILHGDLTSNNIAFNDKEEPVLIDFDLSFTFDEAKTMIPFIHWMKSGFGASSVEKMIEMENRDLTNIFEGDIISE